ncbi:MAG: ATP-binding protein [Clostridia bacterium]|nr:ATP-binding protein [Clostridia bacterium]
MNELSLYILDLTQNSVTAGAKNIRITVEFDPESDNLTIIIEDDGCGMDEALLERVTSPFTTTRKTRKVGLGIPMIKQLCEMCEGTFQIESTVNVGTKLKLLFRSSHVDLPPMGDLPETFVALINGTPEGIEFVLEYRKGQEVFIFDTREIRQVLEGVMLNTPDVLMWIREYISEGIREVNQVS